MSDQLRIEARRYSRFGYTDGYLVRDGEEWAFLTLVEVARFHCSSTMDGIVTREDGCEHDGGRIQIDPDGVLAIVDRHGDWRPKNGGLVDCARRTG